MFADTGRWPQMDMENYAWKGMDVLERTQICNMFVASG